jgi:hypothetical protein
VDRREEEGPKEKVCNKKEGEAPASRLTSAQKTPFDLC